MWATMDDNTTVPTVPQRGAIVPEHKGITNAPIKYRIQTNLWN